MLTQNTKPERHFKTITLTIFERMARMGRDSAVRPFASVQGPGLEFGTEPKERSPHGLRAFHNDCFRFGYETTHDAGYSRLQDSGLFARNGRDGSSQFLGMLEFDGRHTRHGGLHSVGGIQATPQPDFQ